MKKPHVHAECIIAWANGAEIEYRTSSEFNWYHVDNPSWNVKHQYRVKPEPKPDRVEFSNVYKNTLGCLSKDSESLDKWARVANETYLGRVRVTFDGETGKLKSMEIIK